MARLHPIVVVPAAVAVLATATHGWSARECAPWSCAEHLTAGRPHAEAVDLAAHLPIAAVEPPATVAAPGVARAAPTPFAPEEATGGAVAASARDPPAQPA